MASNRIEVTVNTLMMAKRDMYINGRHLCFYDFKDFFNSMRKVVPLPRVDCLTYILPL
jgi:hypothetical protein